MAVLVLAVEGAQRVDLGALEAVLAHLVGVVEDEGADLLAIGRAAGRVAHGVDREAQVLGLEAEALVELHQHDDALGVRRGIGGAEPLDADLVELAQAALLRALAAEHRRGVPELGGSRALRHEVVLDDGAHDAGRALGAHGHALLGLEAVLVASLEEVLEEGTRDNTEHLLAHDVGRLADAVDEGVDLLDGRRLDHVEAVGPEQLARDVLHVLPGAHVAAVQVLGTLDPLCHGDLQSRLSGASGRGHKRRTARVAFHGCSGKV